MYASCTATLGVQTILQRYNGLQYVEQRTRFVVVVAHVRHSRFCNALQLYFR